MRFLIQRVSEARVETEGKVIGEIGPGLLVFIGVGERDTRHTADRMIKKLLGLRIFEDGEGKTNLDLAAVSGQLLMISQFTLYADCKKGNRPSFVHAGQPETARKLYDYTAEECAKLVPVVERGEFGADMKVHLCNDGPFTVMLDSDELFVGREKP